MGISRFISKVVSVLLNLMVLYLIWKLVNLLRFQSKLSYRAKELAVAPALPDHFYCKNVTRVKIDDQDPGYVPQFISAKRSPGLYLHRAYYDNRDALRGETHVRVLAMIKLSELSFLNESHCLLWYEGIRGPYSIKGEWRAVWNPNRGEYLCVIISCKLPNSRKTGLIRQVTVTDELCQIPTHYVQVRHNHIRTRTPKVVICNKVIYKTPDPVRLIEWIEMNKLVGVEKIYMYNSSVEGNSNQVMRYYSQQGYVEVDDHTFPQRFCKKVFKRTFPVPDYYQNWQIELLSMNDCLYSADGKYIINIDIDEILYQDKFPNWKEHVEKFLLVKYPNVSSYVFHTGFFVNEFGPDESLDVPKYLHMLRYNTRTRIDWESPKSLINADITHNIAHHMSSKVFHGYTWRTDILPNDGYLRHYRIFCNLDGEPNKCEKLLKVPYKDNNLLKFIDVLKKRMLLVMNKLNISYSV